MLGVIEGSVVAIVIIFLNVYRLRARECRCVWTCVELRQQLEVPSQDLHLPLLRKVLLLVRSLPIWLNWLAIFSSTAWTVVAITGSPKLMATVTSFGRAQSLGPSHILFLETTGHPHLLYSTIYTDPPLHSAVITGLCALK